MEEERKKGVGEKERNFLASPAQIILLHAAATVQIRHVARLVAMLVVTDILPQPILWGIRFISYLHCLV